MVLTSLMASSFRYFQDRAARTCPHRPEDPFPTGPPALRQPAGVGEGCGNRRRGCGVEAILFIETLVGREWDVVAGIERMAEVLEADVVTGCYDVVARVRVHDSDELFRRVVQDLRSARG